MPPPHRTDVELLLAHTSWLPALARRLVRDDLADDLAQATFTAALEHAPRTTSARRLRAWLTVVARNLARRGARNERDRRHHERATGTDERVAPDPGDELERVHLHKRLAEAVLALDEPCRTAIALRFFAELGYDEIARRQGVTNAAARQRVSRGLAALRVRLDREHDGDRRAWVVALTALAREPGASDSDDPGGPREPARVAPREPHEAGPAADAPLGALARGLVLAGGGGALALSVALGAWIALGASRTGPEPVSARRHASRAAVVSDARSRSSLPLPPSASGTSRVALATAAPIASSAPAALEDVDRGRDLHGLVLDRRGTPLAGARVVLRREETRTWPIPDLEGPLAPADVDERVTGDDGAFVFPLPEGRPHDLVVAHPTEGRAIVSNRYAGERVDVRLERPATLRGRVRRARVDSAPEDGSDGVAGAVLRGWTDDDAFHTVLDGRTDDDGSFVFHDLPAGHLGLQVMPREDSPLPWIRVDLVGGETTTLDVPVVPALRVSGRVTDAATGLPIEGATVALGWRLRQPTKTDADGRYELRGFSVAGHYEVHVRADGYGEGSRLPPPFSKGRATVDVALRAERVVAGRVLDERGAAVEGAYVAAVGRLRTDQGVPNVDCRATLTDADGAYEVRGLRRGQRHSLFVLRDGFGTVAYELPLRNLDEERVRMPDVRLAPALVLRGVVVDPSGRALGGCRVGVRGLNADYGRYASARDDDAAGTGHVDRRRGRADDLGRFAFADLAPGTYDVTVALDGVETEARVALEAADDAREPLRVVLATGSALAGRVVDADGRPVGGATLSARPFDDAGSAERDETAAAPHARTASDGTFRLLGLDARPYALEVVPDRWTASEETRELLRASVGPVLPSDEPLALRLARGVTIEGRVLDASGAPVTRRAVAAVDPDGRELDAMRTRVDGTFALVVEPGAVVEVHVATRTGTGAPELRARGVAAGARDLVLTLP